MPLSWIGRERPHPGAYLVAQELLIVGLVITRRSSTVQSRSLSDWAVALIGTGAPLLLRPGLALPGLTPIGIGLQILSALLATVRSGALDAALVLSRPIAAFVPAASIVLSGIRSMVVT